MSMPFRDVAELPDCFDRRLAACAVELAERDRDCVQVEAAEVYTSGVIAGLQLAIAALQRRERVIDHLARWETRYRQVRARRHG